MYVEMSGVNRRDGGGMAKLTGKVAVVTGASKGIGAAIARRLASDGAAVVVNYASDRAGAEKVAHEIEAGGGTALVAGGSVADRSAVESIFQATRERFGKVDILVNNAGVFAFGPLETIDDKSFDWMFGTNVKGLLFASQAALPLFPAEGGSIINVGSVVSQLAPVGSAVYSGTKGAVDTITKVLAGELGARKIRVNSVNPGMVETEGAVAGGFIGSEFEKAAILRTPLGRTGQPTDIADVVSLLASDEAGWLTGSLLQAAGGFR